MANTPLRNVRVEDELWEQAKQATAARGTNPSEIMRRSLISYVKRHPVTPTMNGSSASPPAGG